MLRDKRVQSEFATTCAQPTQAMCWRRREEGSWEAEAAMFPSQEEDGARVQLGCSVAQEFRGCHTEGSPQHP